MNCSSTLLMHPLVGDNGNDGVVEIYLDETGDPKLDETFGVGGIALIYPNEDAVFTIDEALDSDDVRWGVAEGLNINIPHLPSYLQKDRSGVVRRKLTGRRSAK
jgi:hypothetical protein